MLIAAPPLHDFCDCFLNDNNIRNNRIAKLDLPATVRRETRDLQRCVFSLSLFRVMFFINTNTDDYSNFGNKIY